MFFTILKIILGFGAIIGLHEFAHMMVSKFFKVKVLKFSMGFGPLLFSKKIGDTSYELRALPLGGFVQCDGEDPSKNVKNGFFSLPWWKRSLIALAGPIMNLFLGWLFIYALLIMKDWGFVEAAGRAFLLSKMIVWESIKGILGISAAAAHAAPAAGAVPASSAIAGPIMITKIMFDSAKQGMLLLMFGLVSLSIGLFNLFPIPALDGGHIFLYILEGIRGKKFSPKVYMAWNLVGFVLLVTLMLFTCFMDIKHL